MGLKLGIVGLPNVGKSTLFNALSNARAEVSNYPFTTINPNIGIIEVPDVRTAAIAKIKGSKNIIEATIEFLDIAGLVKGVSKGEVLGNQFLANIREVDAIVHVVRAFKDENIVHVEGNVNPTRDIDTINTELLLSDLSILEKKKENLKTAAKTNDKSTLHQLEVIEKLISIIGEGKVLRSAVLNEEEKHGAENIGLLTIKPLIYAVNIDEVDNDASSQHIKTVKKLAENEDSAVIAIRSKLEAELREMTKDDAAQYLLESGITSTGLNELIRNGYETLDLITLFTCNDKETRAWTVAKGTKAPNAAGKIHSDIERGFISAETVHFDDLIAAGSFQKAKEKGLLRLEGKNYEIKDGDVIYFRFNI